MKMAVNKRKQRVRYFNMYLGSVPKAIYSILAQKARNTNLDTNSHKTQADPGMAESQGNPLKEVNDEHKDTY